MDTEIFDGRKFAAIREADLLKRVEALKLEGVIPRLVWISVGHSGENELYGRVKATAAERVGISFEKRVFNEGDIVGDAIDCISRLNEDDEVNGIMVQLPMLRGEERLEGDEFARVLQSISSEKDVDCLSPVSLGRVMIGNPTFLPATVKAAWLILGEAFRGDYEQLRGLRVAVLGGGLEVGKPLVNLLSNHGATVLWLRASENDLSEMLKVADVVISATGKPNLVHGGKLNEGSIVVDVGSPEGDTDYQSLIGKARFVTPVPGGVGPVTVVSLLENVVLAAERAC